MKSPTVHLTDEQIAFYHEQGFLSLPSVSTPEEIATLREAYDRIFARRAGRESGEQFDLAGADEEGKEAALPQILNPSKYAPELVDTYIRANAEHIGRQLLGDLAKFTGDHAILKPPGIGAPTPWHQDEAYWGDNDEVNAFSMWVPLQPVTAANGCMCFVPGSHKKEVLPHHSIGHDPRVHGLEVDAADVTAAVACPLPAGGATLHAPRTLHYTGPNGTDQPRRAYILIVGTPATRRATPRDFYWNKQKHTARDERAKARAAK